MTKIGILDYLGGGGITQELANLLIARKHECTYINNASESTLQEFEALLLHPGVENQVKAIEFYRSHPEKRIAIITRGDSDTSVEYEIVKAHADEIPIFYWSDRRIIDFIEGKSLEPNKSRTKIAIVDYTQLAGQLYARLLVKGYKDVKYSKELSGLENPEEFDVILMHPGIEKQVVALEFAAMHPKIKTAIITPSPGDYRGKLDIPLFSYDSDKIIDFIEGKPLEDI